MKRVYVNLSPDEWDHLVTKYPPDNSHVSIANFTTGTKNIATDIKGDITKHPGSTLYSTLPSSPRDQYEAIFVDGARHLLTVDSGNLRYSSGDQIFNLVTAGYSASANFEFVTTQDRVYFDNGVNSPQVYDRTTTYGGVPYTAPKTKDHGAQPPITAPTVAVVAGGAVPIGAHTYKVTFLYYGFEESNGGPSSAVATTVLGNQQVDLTAIPIGGYGVTARKIYRDDNDGNYVLITTITDNTSTTYSDTSAGGTTPIPTDNFEPPTYGLIASWLNRLWIAKVPGSPYTVFYSDAGLPDIFPSDFHLTCNEQDPITGIVVYFGRLIVFNRRSMGQILGNTSDTFRYDPIQSAVGCVDNRSIQVRVVNGVPLLVWLSHDGFYSYNGNSVEYISDPIENVVNTGIQQSIQQKGFNNQSSQADFFGGTASNGISLTVEPNFITTRAYLDGTSTIGANPKRAWDDQGDWEGGSITTNIVTRDGSNKLKAPTRFTIPYYQLITGNPGTSTNIGTYTNTEPDGAVFTPPNTLTFYQVRLNTTGAFGSPKVGEWLGPIYDSFSAFISTGLVINHTGSFPAGTGCTTRVEGSDSPTFSTIDIFEDFTNLNGSASVSLSGKRYWRVRLTLTTTNIPQTPFIGIPTLTFNNTTTWVSESIDTTSDSTVYNSLTVISDAPAGTSVTIEIATSANDIVYTAFVPFGSHVVQRYAKIRAILVTDASNITTPSVTSIVFKWTIVATFESSTIDTTTTPAGWDIFAASFDTNGGTVQFFMRSGASLVALAAATYYPVTNGNFPDPLVLPLRYTQWKVIITSMADLVPEIDGVTITWFIGSISSLRVASIFVNGKYYMAAAEFGQTANNLIFELDLKAKWRFIRDLSISTLSFFFDKPYYGSGTDGSIAKWLEGFTNLGNNIPIDIRFRDLDFSLQDQDNGEFLKALDYIVLTGTGTGATYQCWFSVDQGNTFTLLKYEDGSTTYTSANDNKKFNVRFKSDKADGNLISGHTILIRITTNDQFDIAVEKVKEFAWVWEFEPFLLG